MLDARDRAAFERGHAPGAAHLPAAAWTDRSAELPPRALAFEVVGDDAAHAAALAETLRERGWTAVRAAAAATLAARAETGPPRAFLWRPSDWLLAQSEALPTHGTALDVATGSGRHAVWLALSGLTTWGIDVLPDALARATHLARATAAIRPLAPCAFACADATRPLPVREGAFDVVCGFRYLDRRQFGAFARLVRPGGQLVWETFTVEQRRFGKPHRAEFLLEPGELERLCDDAGLAVEAAREGSPPGGPALAGVRARRPLAP